ncbi:hypothetical protein [Actinomadura sp. 7K507]|nr:hypothetical protein [Actinomadura sp. 7K507]
MFRKSNLVVKVRYSQYKPRLSAAELDRAALKLAIEISTGLKP